MHVAELVRALRRDIDVQVRCFGGPRDEAGTTAYATPAEFATANAALATMGVDLLMARDAAGADLVHSHTWYANFAGFTAKQLHASRTSSRRTASSRCARGRPSSWAAGTASSWVEDRVRGRRRRDRRERRHAPRHPALVPRHRPSASRSSTTAST